MSGKKKEHKAAAVICHVVGSAVLFAVACIAISEAMPYVSGMINKNAAKRSNARKEEEDWGPVIERKTQTREAGDEAYAD